MQDWCLRSCVTSGLFLSETLLEETSGSLSYACSLLESLTKTRSTKSMAAQLQSTEVTWCLSSESSTAQRNTIELHFWYCRAVHPLDLLKRLKQLWNWIRWTGHLRSGRMQMSWSWTQGTGGITRRPSEGNGNLSHFLFINRFWDFACWRNEESNINQLE